MFVCEFGRVLRSEERKCVVRFGGLVIHNIGQLLPVQIHSGLFNTNEYVYPVSVFSHPLAVVVAVLLVNTNEYVYPVSVFSHPLAVVVAVLFILCDPFITFLLLLLLCCLSSSFTVWDI